MDEMLKAAADCGDYARAHPFEADSRHNPFVTHHGCGIFEYYAKHAAKAERFAKAMAGWRKSMLRFYSMKAPLAHIYNDERTWYRRC